MEFIGRSETVLDSKNRLTVPSDLRAGIDPSREGDHLVLCAAMDPCIWLLTARSWQQLMEQLGLDQGDAVLDSERRNLERYLYASAKRVEIDRQGRVTLPEDLRKMARIEGKVLVIGVKGRIEIWEPETFQRHMASFDPARVGARR